MTKTWFITGTSKGFGRLWAEAALERGDRVAAAARDVRTLDDLGAKFGASILPIALDVADRTADFAAVQHAHAHFGRLDIVINNAGYGHFGAVEELTEAEVRAQMETNFFGALWVTQAALPLLRAQRSGHIIQVSSIGGVAAFGGLGAYHASKWALEAVSESLAQEIAGFGIKITLVEPSGFTTDWSGPSSKRSASEPTYEALWQGRAERAKSYKPGDPAGTVKAILALVDAKEPPLRLLLGSNAVRIANALYPQRLETWKAWQAVSEAADTK